jgi:uncharacterized protein (DUF885 family)
MVRARSLRILTSISILAGGLAVFGQTHDARTIQHLADEYVSLRLQYDPTLAAGLALPPPENMHFADRRPEAIRKLEQSEDALLVELKTAGQSNSKDTTYLVLREELEGRKGLRVCRAELWDLSQTEGWQVEFPGLAANQAVQTPGEKKDALQLWHSLPDYLHIDEANLREGLREGYSVPQSVVVRVLKQLDGLITDAPEDSPFYAPAKRVNDSSFAGSLRDEIQQRITPALRKYEEFLRTIYLPQARKSLGLSALPNGGACYQAYLRRYTTTDQTPDLVFAHGKDLVASSSDQIRAIGSKRYGTNDLAESVRRVHDDPHNRFTSEEQLIQFSREMVERSIGMSRNLFLQLPSQPVIVRPLPDYQRGTGVSSHYQANPDDRKPATFWISVDDWASRTRGAAEITAVHETVPGHHLQIATARRLQPDMKLAGLVFNAAYVEGWANYAERLSEEQGIDGDDYERIERRVLAGRSLVIDPGIHAFGWTRPQAEAFAMEAGMSKDAADDVIDRIAVEPGQLTTYEVGGLAILALREEARAQLGSGFDLPRFHQQILQLGPIPIRSLQEQTRAWIKSQER